MTTRRRLLAARSLAAGALLALAALLACAAKQRIPLDQCVTEKVTVYVDGRQLEGNEAELSTDRPHKIYAKGPGYQSRLVVLEPEVDERGRGAFRDDDLCIEVVPIGMNRELEVDVERDARPKAPAR